MMSPVDFYLIRGLAREARHWGDFVPLLEKQDFVNRVYCLDLPGAGKFRKLTSPLSIAENAEFLISQMEGADGSHPRVVLSVSLGSMVTVEILKRSPELFAKAYVMNTSFANLSPLYHRLQLHAFKQFFMAAKARSNKERELAVVKMVSQSSDKWERISEEWATIADERPMPVKNFFRQLIAAATYRIDKQAPQTPVVVLNSQKDQMVHPSCSRALSEHWSLPLYSNAYAGHDICIDEPEWVIEQLAETIDS